MNRAQIIAALREARPALFANGGDEWIASLSEAELESLLEATWTTAVINDLPDSSFLYIEGGGEKDDAGKTTPRSKRHFPVKDASGEVDLPHLRNALARIPQSKLPAAVKAAAQKKARALAKAAGVGDAKEADGMGASMMTCPDCKGAGEMDGETCSTCKGTGKVSKKKKASTKEARRSWIAEAIATAEPSLDDQLTKIRVAVRQKYQTPAGLEPCEYVYAEVIFDDHVIIRKGDKLYSVTYTVDGDEVDFTSDPVEVRIAYVPAAGETKEAIAGSFGRRKGQGYVIGPRLEAEETEPSGAEWDVIVIESGLSSNRNLYEAKVLEAAVPKYEGARMFLDHQEEPRRFGRSVKDLVGFIRDPRPAFVAHEAEGAAVFAIAATACLTRQDFRAEMLEAHRLGKPDLFGLSHDIRAKSQAQMLSSGPAVKVESIEKVDSVDFVTNPAAGGRVLRLVASDVVATSLEEDGRMLQKLIAQLRSMPQGAKLLEALGAEPTEDQVLEAIRKALEAMPARSDAAAAATPAATPAAAGAAAAGTGTGTVTLTEAEVASLRESGRVIAELRLERDLAECALPDPLKKRIRDRFKKRMDAGATPSQADITEAIRESVEDYGALAEAKVVLPIAGRVQVGEGQVEKTIARLDAFFDPTKTPASFREMYVDITGDRRFSGKLSEATRLKESLSTTSFDQALGDSITRRMLQYYAAPEFANWRLIARTNNLNDFRTQRRIRFGGYGNLPIVNQGQTYLGLTSPTDEEATYSPSKRGGTESVTLEMIRNDDVQSIRDIPNRIGRAAAQTLYEFVWDFLATNAAIYDSVALAAAGHGNNILTTALSASNVSTLRLKMKNQTDMSNSKRLGLRAKILIVPNDLEELAFQITTALKAVPDASLSAQAEPAAPNFLSQKVRLEVVVVDYWTDANNYWLAASPDQTPMLEVGFLDGNENPEIFVQDQPNVGSMFNSDQLTWKIRHIYGGAVMDFRGFGAGIVA